MYWYDTYSNSALFPGEVSFQVALAQVNVLIDTIVKK